MFMPPNWLNAREVNAFYNTWYRKRSITSKRKTASATIIESRCAIASASGLALLDPESYVPIRFASAKVRRRR